ncbi:MAG: hypothetical protein R3Y36_03530 [Spirochaetales bacterium]
MAENTDSFDQFDFLVSLEVAMKLMGFQAEVVELEEYPVSIEAKVPGYEDLPVDLVLIFLPLEKAVNDQVQILQIYFSLYDDDVAPEKFEQLRRLCNTANTSSSVGVFGVQEDIQRICYKQGVVLRPETNKDIALQSAMDVLLLMSLALDTHYDAILNCIAE